MHLRISDEVQEVINARTDSGAAKESLAVWRIVGLMARHSKDTKAGRIDVLRAETNQVEELPAKSHVLRHKGRDCYAYVRITSQRERAVGGPDAVITVDEWEWDQMSRRQREAVIAHELEHLEVNENGVLKIRPHDFEVGWFGKIAAEFGEDSIERIQARKLLADEIGQLFFPGMEPPKVPIPPFKSAYSTVRARKIAEKQAAEQAQLTDGQTDLEQEIKTRQRPRFTEGGES